MKLNQAQKRAASFIAAILVVAIGSMLFESAHQAITSAWHTAPM